MSDSVSLPSNTPAPAVGDAGEWELDLWSGTAWFNDWFYRRLRWAGEAGRKTLFDLKPHLMSGAWEALLLAIRALLERGVPLDTQIGVELEGGRIEWWRVLGTAERNTGGQPVYLTGSMRDAGAASPSHGPKPGSELP